MIWHRRGDGCHLQGVYTQCSLRWIPDAASVFWAKFPHGCLIIAFSKNHFFFFGKVLNKSMHKTLLGSSRKCVGVLLKGQAMVLAVLTSWDSWWFRGQDMIIPRGQRKQNFRLTFKLSKCETWLERIMLVKVQPMSFWETSGKPKWGSFCQKIKCPRLFKSQRDTERPWGNHPGILFHLLCSLSFASRFIYTGAWSPVPILSRCWPVGWMVTFISCLPLHRCWVLPLFLNTSGDLCLFWLSPGVPLGDILEHVWLQV